MWKHLEHQIMFIRYFLQHILIENLFELVYINIYDPISFIKISTEHIFGSVFIWTYTCQYIFLKNTVKVKRRYLEQS